MRIFNQLKARLDLISAKEMAKVHAGLTDATTALTVATNDVTTATNRVKAATYWLAGVTVALGVLELIKSLLRR